MAPIEIHNSETHWTSALDIVNEIHDPIMIFMIYLTRVVTHKGLEECFWPHILAPLPTIKGELGDLSSVHKYKHLHKRRFLQL